MTWLARLMLAVRTRIWTWIVCTIGIAMCLTIYGYSLYWVESYHDAYENVEPTVQEEVDHLNTERI